MSPEQASGQKLDARSDIFSFGSVLYELLAGSKPFAGATSLEILQKIIHEPARPVGEDVPVALRMVVEKALEKDPAERYQSMREMVVDLRRVARLSGQSAPVSNGRTAAKPRPAVRNAILLTLAILAAAGITLVAKGVLLMAVPVTTQPGFSPGTPAFLFEENTLDSVTPQYDVTADGKRFILRERLMNEKPQAIHVVNNWYEEFRPKTQE